MSKFFINRPIVAIVISILTVIVGAITIVTLPVAQFPKTAPPEIRLQANYPGADAQTLERRTISVEFSPTVETDFGSFNSRTLFVTSAHPLSTTYRTPVFGMRIANSVGRGNTMFKISVIDSRTVRRLVLEGTFITPWVAELRATWAAANVDLQDRKLVLDLKNVTRISKEGEDALSDLMREGATFSCDDVLTKHVLEQLARKSKKDT